MVATASGSLAIGSLRPGNQVWAYNQQSKKMELEVVRHLWITQDNDLVDLTLTHKTAASKGKAAQQSSETIHTNKKHPFLTVEKGFVSVGQLKLGMHIVESGSRVGVVTGWLSVPGAQVMYNLEVTRDHTYTVGVGQWVVHNASPICISQGFNYSKKIGKQMLKRGWDDERVAEAIRNPSETIPWRDSRNIGNGLKVADEPATVYYHAEGGYVSVNNVTNDIIQVSNVNDPGWFGDWDPIVGSE